MQLARHVTMKYMGDFPRSSSENIHCSYLTHAYWMVDESGWHIIGDNKYEHMKFRWNIDFFDLIAITAIVNRFGSVLIMARDSGLYFVSEAIQYDFKVDHITAHIGKITSIVAIRNEYNVDIGDSYYLIFNNRWLCNVNHLGVELICMMNCSLEVMLFSRLSVNTERILALKTFMRRHYQLRKYVIYRIILSHLIELFNTDGIHIDMRIAL